MIKRQTGDWMSSALTDMIGKEIKLGDKLAKAFQSGRSVNLSICEVTQIENGKVYLDNSKVAIKYPGRTLVVSELFESEGARIEHITE